MSAYTYEYGSTSSTIYVTTTADRNGLSDLSFSESSPTTKEKNAVFGHDIFKVAFDVFKTVRYVMIFTSKSSKYSSDITLLRAKKAVFLHNPNSKDPTEPELGTVEAALLIDCLEPVPNFMQRANIIKHAFVCIYKDAKPLVLVATEGPETTKKDGSGGMEELELSRLLYFAGAKSVIKPTTLDVHIETPYLIATG